MVRKQEYQSVVQCDCLGEVSPEKGCGDNKLSGSYVDSVDDFHSGCRNVSH